MSVGDSVACAGDLRRRLLVSIPPHSGHATGYLILERRLTAACGIERAGFFCLYVLHRRKRIYYIGLTTDLLGRIKGHAKWRAGKWDHFRFFRIQKVRYLKDIETLLHRLVDTPGNKVKGKVPRDADLNRVLREVLREHEHTIWDIRRAIRH